MSEMKAVGDILLRELPKLRARIVARGTPAPRDELGLPLDRRLCPECEGRGYAHCRRCLGTGLVCPYCRGFRVFSQQHSEHPHAYVPQRACPHCTDWEERSAKERYGPHGRVEFRVDRLREAEAILRWAEEHE